MASKGGGQRASGTDGSDHSFRQRVDGKYAKAAAARKSLKSLLLGCFVYYPIMLAFALAPPLLTTGIAGVTLYNGPFAAGAAGGLVLALATYAHVSGIKHRPGWLRAVTKVMAVLGIVNLGAGLGMRLFAHEDARMAWGAWELVKQVTGVTHNRFYPILVSMELLLEFVGAILPTGVVATAYMFTLYAAPATTAAAKS
eukprot:CAMPEP_0197609506 /NCGR_PEP_ID=MMETSP1326-20131121/51342_1 /TAXON_ID=1155430 /ORGANISM="Genus nov. species nov., Strain RCC2288" /LENGTH=197 /DNA_ID=CAMNT_0043177881 /DNA_START=23 /DNA_END=613 /DNA_ORIENTATION=-